ncbi:MAG: DUF4172 domain-containing protein [Roseomonas sp.]|nr:DUF4172 domain-containing protein [Roseomonas sp.]
MDMLFLMKWDWQKPAWPQFQWDARALSEREGRIDRRKLHGHHRHVSGDCHPGPRRSGREGGANARGGASAYALLAQYPVCGTVVRLSQKASAPGARHCA